MKNAYVRTEEAPTLPPPPSQKGITGWLWQNVFASMANYSTIGSAFVSILMIVLTIFFGFALFWMCWKFIDFTIISAVWTDPSGGKKETCNVHGAGMCWPFIYEWFYAIMVGNEYPREEAWRVYTIFAMLAAGIAWLVIEGMPKKVWVAAFMLILFPIIAFAFLNGSPVISTEAFDWTGKFIILLVGAIIIGIGLSMGRGEMDDVSNTISPIVLAVGALIVAFALIPLFAATIDSVFGFEVVRTSQWGGLLITLVVALSGIIVSLPLGVLLALGRQSNAPLIKWVCIIFIEGVRGIPLISVLFFASVMLQYFLPSDFDFNKLLRALVGVALFASAYMAEVVRGGLQAMPKGQYEGSMSLGLSYWQQMRLIILPQALTTVIPGIVNTFIGLFKDTVLVLIIALFDILGMVQARALKDIEWYGPTHAPTGYIFAGLLFWLACFGMSRYSMYMERKLHRGH